MLISQIKWGVLMKNIDLNLLRANVLLHQDEIRSQMNRSPYFYDFLQIGFLDFFFLSYANLVTFDDQEYIIQSLELGYGWEHFFENFCFQAKITTEQLLEYFFLAMETFQSYNNLEKLNMVHIGCTWNQELLNSIPYYFNYICTYAIDGCVWKQIIDIIVDTMVKNNEEDYYTAIDFFELQLEFFPENIQQSILMTLGLQLGIVLYSPSRNQINYGSLVDWISNEIHKKKVRQRTFTSQSEIA